MPALVLQNPAGRSLIRRRGNLLPKGCYTPRRQEEGSERGLLV